jgi:hypothetical protein
MARSNAAAIERGRQIALNIREKMKRAPKRRRWIGLGGLAYVEVKRINDLDGQVAEVQLVRAGREKLDLPRWWTIGELNKAGIRPRA